MKKRIILLAAILSVLTLFTSCVRTIPESPSSESTAEEKSAPYEPRPVPSFISAWEYCIYENYLFARVGTSIKYQKLNNLQNGGFSVSDKSTDNSIGNLGISGSNIKLLVDVEGTNNNNGSPILVISYANFSFDSISKKVNLLQQYYFSIQLRKSLKPFNQISRKIFVIWYCIKTIFFM